MDFNAMRALVQTDLTAADQLIDNCLNTEISLINQLGQHLIQSGGKRLRPLVVLLCARAFAYEGAQHIKLAAIIELIHTATLLHDDVVDASEMRRGKKTANAMWGNTASILVGDFLYSRAFQLMVDIDSLPIMKILADATNVIAKGEIMQLQNCRDPQVTEARYLEVIRAKTGALFATAAQVGPALCRRSEQEISALANYGAYLGMAFQLIDDVLDYTSTSDVIGKNRGSDLAEGKPTLPLIYALQHCNSQQAGYIKTAIQEAKSDDFSLILEAIESTGAIAYTYQQGRQYAEQAIGYLNVVPDSPYRTALFDLANFAVERAY